jgi:signal transduction histidine kinase
MARQLNQTEQMRQEFISNVSHELQSPLTSIRGFALVLRNDGLTGEERAHYLEIIENESQRLSRITDNLLRLASLEADQAPFEPRLYRLDRQIREQILACEPQWSAKDIEMDVFLDEVSLNADADLLSQVWINLIHNSIKFTRPGGLVEMWLEQAGEWVEFKIRDSGPGIPDEDLGRVFERFYKADKARQRSKEGSGLGLSIAQKIVQMHGGEIWVERSQPGQNGAGAVFRVRLPAKR